MLCVMPDPLPANDVQAGDLHARHLQLCNWATRFNRAMLALIADEDDSCDLGFTSTMEQGMDLPCG